MKLAIVGSVRFTHPDAFQLAADIIRHKFRVFDPEEFISGGEPDGVDGLAEKLATEHGIPEERRKIFLPKSHRWAPNGYQDRNILIAETCTHLLAIRDHRSKSNGWMDTAPYGTYGSGWTADFAEGLGRRVERIVL